MNNKNFNSKNIAKRVKLLIDAGQENLALEILKTEELKNLLPNVLKILQKEATKKEEFSKTKVYSKTSISKETLKQLEKVLEIKAADAEIIIDKNMSAGVKIKQGGTVVDATFQTMLEQALTKMLN